MHDESRSDVRPAMPSGDAARVLGVSNTTIVNWLEQDVLEGYSVAGQERRRHFVFVDSIARLQAGGRPAPDGPGANPESRHRDEWRERAARAETHASYLREAFDEVLAAYHDEQRAAARLRRAIEIQKRALDSEAVDDDEISR